MHPERTPDNSSGATMCWRVKLVAAPISNSPDGVCPWHGPVPALHLGVRIACDMNRVIARFHVTASDAEAAAVSAVSRWRRVQTLSGVPDWPVSSLSIERHDPDPRRWVARSHPTDKRSRPTIDLRRRLGADRARLGPTVLGQPLIPPIAHPYSTNSRAPGNPFACSED